MMEGVPAYIKAVPEKYEAVFQTPQGLPPQRSRDHVLTLNGGNCPNQRETLHVSLCTKARN